MRAAPAALAVAIGAISLSAPATARADVLPHGRLSALGGIRNGTSSLGDAFGLGALYGVEAAWEPLHDGHRLGYAILWDVAFCTFGSDPAAISGSLDEVELSLGARLRFAPRDPARTLFLGGGGSLLRTSTPLPPSEKRAYAGGYVGFGLEQLALGKALVTLELRYGLIGGPGSITVLLGVGFGV